MNKLLAALILLLAAAVLHGQSPAIPRVPPLDKAAFTVTFVEAASAPHRKAPDMPVTIAVTRFDAVQRNQITWHNGSRSESFFIDQLLAAPSRTGNWINIFDRNNDPIDPIYSSVLPGFFDWVGTATFAGLDQFEGRPANLFQRPGEKVWAHPETGYPLAWTDDVQTLTFTFSRPPAALPEMQENLKKELDRYRRIATVPKQISNRP